MLSYALDNLGWSDFERLVQVLLKVKLGLGVEAWGGSGDFGRDAYFKGTIDYPTHATKGHFVFQVKFVDAANAAGAKPRAAIMGAVKKEAVRISNRILKGELPPTHYVIFTNAPCSPETRVQISDSIVAAFGEVPVEIHIHDGRDVCTWLDSQKDIARAFPTILGFQNS